MIPQKENKEHVKIVRSFSGTMGPESSPGNVAPEKGSVVCYTCLSFPVKNGDAEPLIEVADCCNSNCLFLHLILCLKFFAKGG